MQQLFRKPFTNLFPAKYTPRSVTGYLDSVSKGEAKINPPIEIPEAFRGAIKQDQAKCTGCGLCARMCPAYAITVYKSEKRISIDTFKCIFCAECVIACPTNSLSTSKEFLLATTESSEKKDEV